MIKRYGAVFGLLFGFGLVLGVPGSVWAHHAMGGEVPTDWWGGLMSGLAHPMVGLDHLSFVVAIGLVSVGQWRGFWLPLVFVLSSIAGTGVHLQGWDLAGVEVMVSASVLIFGLILVVKYWLGELVGSVGGSMVLALLGAIAGVCHGYAYGEAIVGAGMLPLIAYLVGFGMIQLMIALGVYGVVRSLGVLPRWLPVAGLAIAGLGVSSVWQVVAG